jgi:hypothetical protein
MTQYLILSGQEYAALNLSLGLEFGYPSADGKTLRYAPEVVDALRNVSTGLYAMPIEDRCLPFLTDAQKTSLVTVDYLSANGWLSTPGQRISVVLKSELAAMAKDHGPNWFAFAAALSATTGALAAAHFLLHWF